MLYVLTGDGKGKTTGAIGMGVRACGSGKSVLMIQFLKSGGSGEEKTIEKIDNFEIKSFGKTCFILPKEEIEKNPDLIKMGVRVIDNEDIELAKQAWETAKKAVLENVIELLILDEINLALKYNMLLCDEVFDFLKTHKENFDIVLTGRYCPERFLEIAHLVSEVKEVKHPYNNGVKQKKGIEY